MGGCEGVHGRRMIAVAPTDDAIRRMAKQGITSSDDPRITKHLHEGLERREKKDRLESTRARLAIAQKLKEGKLQDLWILKSLTVTWIQSVLCSNRLMDHHFNTDKPVIGIQHGKNFV